MGPTARSEESIFAEALEKSTPAERARFLTAACSDDAEMRDRVEKLLKSHEAGGGFLRKPPTPLVPATPYRPIAERPGTMIGPYKLLEQIGEGGFGVVFMAEQVEPIRRKVALKILKPGMDTRQVVARFEAERQALALMDHPNIAHVFDGGETDSGRPYFVMELVRGVPITEFGDRNRLSVRQRLELFVRTCRAIQHAHQKGVIHRDLKPSNLMVTLHDATPVVKVIDFGIAKATGRPLTDKSLFTGFAHILGTPIYMSPEQAQLSGLDVDTRSDIYSLGVLLYELLTGTTPFDRERLKTAAYDEIRRIIREEEPPLPSTRLSSLGSAATTPSANRRSDPKRLSRVCRGELDWIVMKSLEKDRNRRYESASALAADVERYLRDEPVHACPPSAWYRLRKLARRHKAILATAAALGLSAVVSVTVLAISNARIARALASETQTKEELNNALARERNNFYRYAFGLARRDWLANDIEQARRNLEACPTELRDRDWRYLDRVCRAEVLRVKSAANPGRIRYSPDGQLIAWVGTGTLFTGLALWDAHTGQKLFTSLMVSGTDSSLAFSPDGKQLMWATTTTPSLFALNPIVRATGYKLGVSVWDVEKQVQVANFSRDCSSQGRVTLSPDGSRVALVDQNRASICESRTGRELFDLEGPISDVWVGPVFHPSRQLLATFGRGPILRFWDGATGKPARSVVLEGLTVRMLAFGPDGHRLAGTTFGAAREPEAVRVWDVPGGREVACLRGHTGGITQLTFSPDGRRLASAGSDKTIVLWDLDHGRELLTFRGHTGTIVGLGFSPDGTRLASSGSDGTLRIWDTGPVEIDTGPVHTDNPR